VADPAGRPAPKNPYRSKEWRAFRDVVLERDGWRCTDCGRGEDDGVRLQVHHDEYPPPGVPIWACDPAVCRALCRGCHAREHGLIAPREGWDYLGEEDLGDLCGACELCGTEIRYVHFIDHPRWYPMEVGCDCCDKLTHTDQAAEARRAREALARRRRVFIRSPRWKPFEGGAFIEQGDLRAEVRLDAQGHYLVLGGVPDTKRFSDADELRGRLFDFIESGQAEEYLRRRAGTDTRSRPRNALLQ